MRIALLALPPDAACSPRRRWPPTTATAPARPRTATACGGFDAEASSAALARDGWKFLAMSTLSWPDGRQAVVTLWENQLGDFARCFDYFDAKMMQTGGKCERSGTGL